MKITRELKDHEILTALVAGMIEMGDRAHPSGGAMTVKDAVNYAERIVAEVVERTGDQESAD